uniref:Putative lipocal-1 1 n=1 Tax=Amblyomma triste TaxID=251400 RepID=A0A023G6C8_AMBTT
MQVFPPAYQLEYDQRTTCAMINPALSICLLNAAIFISAYRFEDAARNFPRQHVADMISVRDFWFVKYRNYFSISVFPCHAMKWLQQKHANEHVYVVYYTSGQNQLAHNKFLTEVKTSKTSTHHQPNAVAFRTQKNGPLFIFKLMFINEKRSCAVLVRKRWSPREAECLLLQTASTAVLPVPQECKFVYDRHCGGESIKLFDLRCMDIVNGNQG